ncbi:MAG TPA: SCO family protein [Burkholderiales bacterium]|nr:SCO family protein [Burkholderiales bacterium]
MTAETAVRLTRATARAAILALLMVPLLAGCGSKPHHFSLIKVPSGHEADLKLPDQAAVSGKKVSAQSLHGDWVILYFGYTHCPNICPLTLSEFNAALKKLDAKQADKVRVIFVSVDPKRDTRQLLEQYVHAFNPAFIAFRPDPPTLKQMTKRYHISYSYGKPDASGNYTVGHSSEFMIFGPQGHMRLMGNYGDSAKAIAGDLRYDIQHG